MDKEKLDDLFLTILDVIWGVGDDPPYFPGVEGYAAYRHGVLDAWEEVERFRQEWMRQNGGGDKMIGPRDGGGQKPGLDDRGDEGI